MIQDEQPLGVNACHLLVRVLVSSAEAVSNHGFAQQLCNSPTEKFSPASAKALGAWQNS